MPLQFFSDLLLFHYEEGLHQLGVTVIDSRALLPHRICKMFDSLAGEDPAGAQLENYQFISSVCLSPVSRLFPERAAHFLSSPSSV